MQSPIPAGNEPDAVTLHRALVDQLKKNGHIQDARIEAAFRAIPRHLFLPSVPLTEVYRDQAIATKSINGLFVSSSSQPTIMAIMLEQLQLQPGQRVLEIGAGTGYNAALMAHIVGETGEIVTIDIDEDIVAAARAHLAPYAHVKVICADGGLGYADGAPYDRIILTVNSADIAPAWFAQLKPNGRLLLPLVLRGPQVSTVFMSVGDHLESLSVRACGFVGLRGAFAEAETIIQLHPEPGQLMLRLGEARPIDAQAINALLNGPIQDIPLSLNATARDLFFSLGFWLALHEPLFCTLSAHSSLAKQGIIPILINFPSKTVTTAGLLNESSLVLLMRNSNSIPSDRSEDILPFEIVLRSFGPAQVLTEQLKRQIMAWDAAGRPGERQLHVRAYPQNSSYNLNATDILIAKKWTNFVYNW